MALALLPDGESDVPELPLFELTPVLEPRPEFAVGALLLATFRLVTVGEPCPGNVCATYIDSPTIAPSAPSTAPVVRLAIFARPLSLALDLLSTPVLVESRCIWIGI